MTYKTIKLGFDKTWMNEADLDDVTTIKNWADANMSSNYTIDWHLDDDTDSIMELTATNVSEKTVAFALLSLQGMKILEITNYNTHPDVTHLFDFGDD